MTTKKIKYDEIIADGKSNHFYCRNTNDYFTEQGTILCKSYSRYSLEDIIKNNLEINLSKDKIKI